LHVIERDSPVTQHWKLICPQESDGERALFVASGIKPIRYPRIALRYHEPDHSVFISNCLGVIQ